MGISAGFAKVDLMDILSSKRHCEMPICGTGFYLAGNKKNSFFFTVDFMDFDLQTVSALQAAVETILPAGTKIHIITTHNHGADSCTQLDMERFCFHAKECAKAAVSGTKKAKIRIAAGQLEKRITFTRRISVPETGSSFTCFYGIDEAKTGDAGNFVSRAVQSLKNNALCFTGDGTTSANSSLTFPAADQDIAVLEFRATDGEPLGNIVRYSSHAVCCNLPDCYSSDFPGYLRQMMEKHLGGISLFFNGPCAEIAPVIAAKSPECGRTFAKLLAEKALSLLEKSEFQELEHFNDRIWQLPLPVRQEVISGKVELPADPASTDDLKERKALLERQRVKAILPFLDGIYRNGVKSPDGNITVSTALLELNNWNLLFFCGETFSRTAKEITAHFPEKQWITVTEHGRTAMYIPPEQEYCSGGYEPTCAVVSERGENELKTQMIRLLEKL